VRIIANASSVILISSGVRWNDELYLDIIVVEVVLNLSTGLTEKAQAAVFDVLDDKAATIAVAQDQ
jgi:hypothetical protein